MRYSMPQLSEAFDLAHLIKIYYDTLCIITPYLNTLYSTFPLFLRKFFFSFSSVK